jgi:hypothetical protein
MHEHGRDDADNGRGGGDGGEGKKGTGGEREEGGPAHHRKSPYFETQPLGLFGLWYGATYLILCS